MVRPLFHIRYRMYRTGETRIEQVPSRYDYNLLYHYRKSCPYTKNYIERDVRDQVGYFKLLCFLIN